MTNIFLKWAHFLNLYSLICNFDESLTSNILPFKSNRSSLSYHALVQNCNSMQLLDTVWTVFVKTQLVTLKLKSQKCCRTHRLWFEDSSAQTGLFCHLTKGDPRIHRCTVDRRVRAMRGWIKEILHERCDPTQYSVLVRDAYWFFPVPLTFYWHEFVSLSLNQKEYW